MRAVALYFVCLVAMKPTAYAVPCGGDHLYAQAIRDGCSSVGGNLVIAYWSEASLPGLQLESIGGSLIVSSNPSLETLLGLRVDVINGSALVQANPVLANLTAPGALGIVGGDVRIRANDVLVSIGGLIGATVRGNIDILENAVFSQLGDLCNVTVEGNVSFRSGPDAATSTFACGVSTFASLDDLKVAVDEYVSNPSISEAARGPIGEWDVSRMTSFSRLFDGKAFLLPNEHRGGRQAEGLERESHELKRRVARCVAPHAHVLRGRDAVALCE